MNNVRETIDAFGEPFGINPDWKYHSGTDYQRTISIFKSGIMSKTRLIKEGIMDKVPRYLGENGMDYISLAVRTSHPVAYNIYIKDLDAVIVSDELPTMRKRTVTMPTYGLRALFQKEYTYEENVSIHPDEVQVKDYIDPNSFVGLKIGEIGFFTYDIASSLLISGKDIMLYDFQTQKRLKASELVKRLSLR